MANVNAPFGFKPVSRYGGGPWSTTEYAKPASDTNYGIWAFDMLMKAASAGAMPERTDLNLPGCQSGQNGTPATSLWLGASLNYGAISTLTPHLVTDEPDVIYMAQTDGTTSISTASHVGKNANILLTQQANSNLKTSQMSVNHTGIATTSSLDLRIQRISGIAPNAEGVYAIVEVTINKHALGLQTAGV